ncbi:protein kinase [Pseudofrankia sp. DC12]|uniref:protein kinase family protein n=1 Tax=Pseudofrankia sp. DC12 TaxID=683315 RepID=UPI0005F89462|nr:protein kinase [Pseudofrankia sp. DC12]
MSDAGFWVGPFTAPDKYRLVENVGGGGEGEVWRAHLQLSMAGRGTVAVKIMPARPGDEADWEKTDRLLSTLRHPGLVRVTAVFTGPKMHPAEGADPSTRFGYVVMDFVEGMTLREWYDENPEALVSERIRKLRNVAGALDEMHSGRLTAVPVAHGDVKPANIVVDRDGSTMLVDLGLARLTDATGVSGRSAPYAAPELRLHGAMATTSADWYAFAATTAQVLLGEKLPTTQEGWLDEAALAELLHRDELTGRRPALIHHVLRTLAARPEERPGQPGWAAAQHADPLARRRGRRTLASGGMDATMRTWSVSSQSLLSSQSFNNEVWEVVFAPGGGTVAVACRDKTVQVWNLSNPRSPSSVATLDGHSDLVSSVAWVPGGRTIVSGSWDTTVRLWTSG